MSAKSRSKRNRMWERNPHCVYCGVKTVKPDQNNGGGHQDENQATLEHLYTKMDWRREYYKGQRNMYAIACYSCNQQKERDEHAMYGVDLLLQKSGHYYKIHAPVQLNKAL